MKRLTLLTILLLLIFTAATPFVAFAEQSDTIYPEDGEFTKSLTFTALTDYAVDGDEYIFLENGTVYSYKDGTPPQAIEEYEFPAAAEELTVGNYYYYFDDDGYLTVHDKSSKITKTLDGSFSNLKQFDGNVFAMLGNEVFQLDGANTRKLDLSYTDYSATLKINVGQTPSLLSDYTLKFVTLNAGTYVTQIDLTLLDGEYFAAGETAALPKSCEALLLCYSGNAAIVAIGDNAYILLKSQTTEINENRLTAAEFTSATMIGRDVYSAPFVSLNAAANCLGQVVTVTGKVECPDVLGFTFYQVEYATEDGTAVGYVTKGFLSGIYVTEDNKQPVEKPDPEYSEKSNVKTVIIVFCVVVLVLAAVGYLAYVGTGGKNKKAKKKDEKPQPSQQK